MFELFIARRYLRAKRKQVVISVITGDFRDRRGRRRDGAGDRAGHHQWIPRYVAEEPAGSHGARFDSRKRPGTGIEHWEQMAPQLAKIPHVRSAAPALYEDGYLNGPVQGSGLVLKGIDVRPGAPVPDSLRHLKTGSLDGLRAGGDNLRGIMLGARLAESIGAVTGKQVTLLIPNGQLTPFGPRPSYVRLRVAGIFETGFYDVDMTRGYMSLPDAQKAYEVPDVINSIELMLDDIYQAPQVAAAAEKSSGPSWPPPPGASRTGSF